MASEALTATEMAGRLRVTPATARAWYRRGWIPAMRAGNRPLRFDAADVLAVLKRRAARKGAA